MSYQFKRYNHEKDFMRMRNFYIENHETTYPYIWTFERWNYMAYFIRDMFEFSIERMEETIGLWENDLGSIVGIVIKYVGNSLIAMRPSDAISIELATSITLFLATIFGFPISGSHVLIFAVVGAGMVKGERPNKKAFRKMIISWVITFPIAAALSALIYSITLAIF